MSYTLNFSDPNKTTTVTVPDMPPGINAVDTSLNLVGRGYPNYGQKYAENFLHLLENFASPTPPQNPIEGQLWYDTSDLRNKVLRIMDGTSNAARWPSATGIYQQVSDPKLSSTVSLKLGDIWVDTKNNQLKIFNSAEWTVVGPSTSTNTGPIVVTLQDNTAPPYTRNFQVIENLVNGVVVSIVTNDSFIPNPVIPGFTVLTTGTNISSFSGINGNASSASALFIQTGTNKVTVSSDKFLRKDADQEILGRVLFLNHNDLIEPRGHDGIVINTARDNNYIQFYKSANDAIILNNTVGGKILFKLYDANNKTTLTMANGSVAINTTTTANSPALDVYGSAKIHNTLTVSSTSSNALIIAGGATIGTDLVISNNLTVSATANVVNLSIGQESGSGVAINSVTTGTYDIGTTSHPFRDIYASGRIGTPDSIIYGTLASLSFSGLISAYSTNTNIPVGWLLCDGSSYLQSAYTSLYSVIGKSYGGTDPNFKVPDMRHSTTSTSGYVSYIIKT
jgi:hypothetical protein